MLCLEVRTDDILALLFTLHCEDFFCAAFGSVRRDRRGCARKSHSDGLNNFVQPFVRDRCWWRSWFLEFLYPLSSGICTLHRTPEVLRAHCTRRGLPWDQRRPRLNQTG